MGVANLTKYLYMIKILLIKIKQSAVHNVSGKMHVHTQTGCDTK